MLEVNFDPFPQLTTERLFLRRLEDDDAENIFRMRSDKEVMKHIGKYPVTAIREAQDFITLINENVKNNSGINWAICFKDQPQKLIGTIGLWRIIKEHFRAEIGYMLLPQYWRLGITKEAISAVVHFGFNKMNLHTIEGHLSPLNVASAKTLESAGFIREAYFKEDFFFNGEFGDTAVYSLLKNS